VPASRSRNLALSTVQIPLCDLGVGRFTMTTVCSTNLHTRPTPWKGHLAAYTSQLHAHEEKSPPREVRTGEPCKSADTVAVPDTRSRFFRGSHLRHRLPLCMPAGPPRPSGTVARGTFDRAPRGARPAAADPAQEESTTPQAGRLPAETECKDERTMPRSTLIRAPGRRPSPPEGRPPRPSRCRLSSTGGKNRLIEASRTSPTTMAMASSKDAGLSNYTRG
jgi:hypothetical protein